MLFNKRNRARQNKLYEKVGQPVIQMAASLGLRVPNSIRRLAERYIGMAILVILFRQQGLRESTEEALLEYLANEAGLETAINGAPDFTLIGEYLRQWHKTAALLSRY